MDGTTRSRSPIRSWVTSWGRTFGLPGPDDVHAYVPRYDEAAALEVKNHAHALLARDGRDAYPWRIRWVKVSAVRGLQERVIRAKVATFARALVGSRAKEIPVPFVVVVGGVPYVWNGHHRFAALAVLGRVRVRCWVRSLPPLANRSGGM